MLVSFSWNSSGLLFSLGLNLVGETGGKSFMQLEVLYISSQINVVCMYTNDEFFSWQLLNDTKITHSQLKLQFHKEWYACISQDWIFNSLFLTFILLFSFYSLHIFQLFFLCVSYFLSRVLQLLSSLQAGADHGYPRPAVLDMMV